jgi:hypothetical protein
MAKKNADVPAVEPIDTSVPAQPAATEAPAVEPIDTSVPAQPAATEAPAVEVEKPSKASKTEVVVKYRDHKGEETSRTFSKEIHGENFAKLAEEFKETNASRIIA